MMMVRHWRQLNVTGILLAFLAAIAKAEDPHRNTLGLVRRNLEDTSAYEWDITDFSVRFDRCQFVKMYDDEMAEDEDSESPLAVKHFVAFRLCPSDECGECDDIFGRYVVDVEDYLEATVEDQRISFESMCENCQERCNDDGEYCSGCGKLCYQYDNLENNGYLDASEYIQCQQLDVNNNDGSAIYIGPRCSRDGSRILIGLFSDENCWEPYTDMEPEDVLGADLSYHLLSHTYSNDGSVCLSCKEDENANENDQADADDVKEMCENIYDASAKCESKTGIQAGFIQMKKEDEEYENQVENEFLVCNFIDSLLWSSYTETGEINVDAPQDEIIRVMTTPQKLSLSLLGVAMLALGGAILYLNYEIKKYLPRAELARQSEHQLT